MGMRFFSIRSISTQAPASYTIGTGGCFSGGEAADAEADHSPPPNAKDKNAGAVPPLPHSSWRCFYLIKSKDNFVFSL
jgi:hypothetical protein